MQIVEYETDGGKSAFAEWFGALDSRAAAKVAVGLAKLEAGNTSNVKGVGGGVSELKIDFGPGYRIYFGREGDRLVILLGGGTKRRQQADIEASLGRWKDYLRRRKEAPWP